MQTFNVNSEKEATYSGWLPGSDQLATKLVNCRALEQSREQLFLEHGKSIDPSTLASVQAYIRETSTTLARLNKARADLRDQLTKDTMLDSLRLTYRVLKYEFGKASVLIGCIAPEPTASKALCAIGIAILAEDTVSVLDGSITKTTISDRAKKLDSDIAKLQVQYDSLLKTKDRFKLDLAKERYTEIFENMCAVVQRQCL